MQSLSVELGWALSREEKEQAPIKKMFESEGRGSEEGERRSMERLSMCRLEILLAQ